MTTSTSVRIAAIDDERRYPVHEEDNVPENPPDESTVRYARDGLASLFPDALVTGDVCIYWERGNRRLYVAPDVLVVLGRPGPMPEQTYLLWMEPPVSFVMEIGSPRTRRVDLEKKPEIYSQRVKAQEYLYADPPTRCRREKRMRLWRLGPNGYEEVAPEPGVPAEGGSRRLRSEVLGVEFGYDEAGLLRIYLDGVPQPTHEEMKQRAEEETRRRQEAETRAGEELLRRQEAEDRRQEAEARAAEETARRQELERQLAELRAQLERGDHDPRPE